MQSAPYVIVTNGADRFTLYSNFLPIDRCGEGDGAGDVEVVGQRGGHVGAGGGVLPEVVPVLVALDLLQFLGRQVVVLGQHLHQPLVVQRLSVLQFLYLLHAEVVLSVRALMSALS